MSESRDASDHSCSLSIALADDANTNEMESAGDCLDIPVQSLPSTG